MIVIKYGGHALPKDGSSDPSLHLIAVEFKQGRKIVLVHGGGPQIDQELKLHGIVPEMVNGLRKTTPEVLKVVEKVLSGEILRNIVNQLVALGVNAVGLSSGDGQIIRAIKKSDELGLVGEIIDTNPALLVSLIESGYFPVISPIGVSDSGLGLNLNADQVAGAIGGALNADRVLFMTDVAGIYENFPDESTLLREISYADLLAKSEKFSGGMAPKVSALLNAIKSGAKSAYVFDGRSAENLKLAIHHEIGTKVSL